VKESGGMRKRLVTPLVLTYSNNSDNHVNDDDDDDIEANDNDDNVIGKKSI
jgi:hypothetical protein